MKFKGFFYFLFCLWLLVSLNFILLRILPGGPFDDLVAGASLVRDQMIQEYGLKNSLFIQYGVFFRNVLHGNFGPSYSNPGQSALSVILEHGMSSMVLSLSAFFLSLILAALVVSLYFSNFWGVGKKSSQILFLLTASLPQVLLVPAAVLVFCVYLNWFPLAFLSSWTHYLLPTFLLALRPSMFLSRSLINSMEEEIRQDYVRTATAKGLNRFEILSRHVLKNSIVTVLALLPSVCVSLVSGSAFVELIFSVPGLGSLFLDSMRERDYFVVSGLVMVFGASLMFLSFVFNALAQRIDLRLKEAL